MAWSVKRRPSGRNPCVDQLVPEPIVGKLQKVLVGHPEPLRRTLHDVLLAIERFDGIANRGPVLGFVKPVRSANGSAAMPFMLQIPTPASEWKYAVSAIRTMASSLRGCQCGRHIAIP